MAAPTDRSAEETVLRSENDQSSWMSCVDRKECRRLRGDGLVGCADIDQWSVLCMVPEPERKHVIVYD